MKRSLINKATALILASVLLFSFAACAKKEAAPALKDCAISHDEKFGGVYANISIDDFNALGFEYGDSLKVTFSNGYAFDDLPYYNGYYVDIDEPLVVAYPGYPYVEVQVNYGADVWQTAELDGDMTVTIERVEQGKYIKTQNACNIQYSDEQGETSDVQFGNFRAVKVGNLRENVLYRGASPIDNKHNRAAVVDRLIADAGVNFVIDLSDDPYDVGRHISADDFNSPYFRSLYESDKVAALGLSAQFKSEAFGLGLAEGLTKASQNDGPYFVHCVEGKDRTGFVMMILEALAGASYKEIVDDYMLTYDNYYGINETSDKERYDTIKTRNIEMMLGYLTGSDAAVYTTADLQPYAEEYLVRIGMTSDAVAALKANLTGE